jgi:sporulation protein YlmC with PRC-barrel domain
MVKVSSLIGKKVITTDAFTVGEVSGVEMDINQWKITHLDVGLAKEATSELGFKKPFMGHIVICVPINLVQGLADVVTLKTTRVELKGIPECKAI